MIKCNECKFWNKKGQWDNDDIYAECDAIVEGIMGEREAIAYVLDCGDGGFHSFHTRYDFGCILGVII